MTLPLDLSIYFSGARLTFTAEQLPAGLSLDPESGVVTGAPTAAGLSNVTVTTRNESGQASASFSWAIEAEVEASPPLNSAAPSFTGDALVGGTLIAMPGVWTGVPTPTIARQWLRDGAAIPDATAASYTPVAADDQRAISLRETAANSAGVAAATSGPAEIRYAAPIAGGALPDRQFALTSGAQTVDASIDFTGAVGGVWSVSGAGAVIDGDGLVTIATDTPHSGVSVTATYTNSGGAASSAFEASVASAPSSITVDSASVRFPEKNNIVEKAGATHLLVPQFAPGANPMWAADGGFIACVEAPWRSYGRPVSGTNYGSAASNGVLGNSNVASGATYTIGIILKAPSNSYGTSYKVVITASGPTNRTTTLDIPLGTAPERLTICARLVGSDLFAEVYSAGALVVGSGALGAPGSGGLRGGGMPLGALGAAGPTPSAFTGHFHGSIGFFGWIDATVSQADMEAISGGADPYTQLSGWRWAKKLTDETDLAPDYDTLAVGNMTVVGTGFMPGGDVLPAADGADRFAVKPLPFGYVWGCMPGEATGTIRLSGTASGVTGEVEARYYNSDG
ncbi:MAG: Ig domain-containing protein, partial [Paracoccaceae bacterium]